MNTYDVTYFNNPDREACMYDIPYHIDIQARDYDEAIIKFKDLSVGYLWSIDIKE